MSETSLSPAPVRARRVRAEGSPVAAPPQAPVSSVFADAPAPRADVNGEALGPVSPERVRKPLGRQTQKLDSSERPGFHRHWFNDERDRIKEALEAGYAYVKDAEGKPMSKVVGTKKEGGPLTAYRMELPLEWYDQDQNAKVVARRQRQHDMQSGVTATGGPGDDGRYLVMGPDGRPMTKVVSSASHRP